VIRFSSFEEDFPLPPRHYGHAVIFLGLFLFFMGFTQAYARYQTPLILKEALLVGFFLAGLVVLGGMQQWWLQPIVSSLEPTALFFQAGLQ
jgi:Putative Na+/H+ antiporter